MFDVASIRSQFPALSQPTPNGHLPIFFDNPAGTQVPRQVMDAVIEYYTTMNANNGGAFATSRRSDDMLQQAREALADFLNAPSSQEIVFGPNMTTLNLGLSRALAKTLPPDAEIVLTVMDHDANIAPWLRIADDYNLNIQWVDMNTDNCTLDMDSLEGALSEKTRIVATVHASNAVGTINPIKQVGEMAHAVGAYFVVDAVQSAPHVTLDVQDLGCDFLLCSAYKYFGPHIGVLWGRHELLAELPVYKVRPAKDDPPYRWETGTPALELIHGTTAAVNYLASINGQGEAELPNGVSQRRLLLEQSMSHIQRHERELASHMIQGLQVISGVTVAGITDPEQMHNRVPTVALVKEGYTSRQIAEFLGEHDVYVWDGDYYAPEIMKRLGHEEDGMVRVGLAHYNMMSEVDRLLELLETL